MMVYPDERVPIARLLKFLEHGERMAADCARAQASLAGDVKSSRFLVSQARQEAMHAKVFQGAIYWLAPRNIGPCPVLQPLEKYRLLIERALREKDWIETILAEQVILEGLGEAILKRIEEGLQKRDVGFGRLRRILIRQEEAHHAFGIRTLESAVGKGLTSFDDLRVTAAAYIPLIHEMVTPLADLFSTIGEDPSAYVSDALGFLPSWLSEGYPNDSSHHTGL